MASINDIMGGLTDTIHRKIQSLSSPAKIPITGIDQRIGATTRQVDPTGERYIPISGIDQTTGATWDQVDPSGTRRGLPSQGPPNDPNNFVPIPPIVNFFRRNTTQSPPSEPQLSTLPSHGPGFKYTSPAETTVTGTPQTSQAVPPITSMNPMWTTGRNGEPLMQNLAPMTDIAPTGPAGTGTPARNLIRTGLGARGDQTEISPNNRYDLQKASQVGTPGGTLSIMGRTPEAIDASIASQKKSMEGMDEINAMASAHGPAAANRVANQIAARRGLQAKESMVPWEIAKTQAEIGHLGAQADLSKAHIDYYQKLIQSGKGGDVAQKETEDKIRASMLEKGATAEEVSKAIDTFKHSAAGDVFHPSVKGKEGGIWEDPTASTPESWSKSGEAAAPSRDEIVNEIKRRKLDVTGGTKTSKADNIQLAEVLPQDVPIGSGMANKAKGLIQLRKELNDAYLNGDDKKAEEIQKQIQQISQGMKDVG